MTQLGRTAALLCSLAVFLFVLPAHAVDETCTWKKHPGAPTNDGIWVPIPGAGFFSLSGWNCDAGDPDPIEFPGILIPPVFTYGATIDNGAIVTLPPIFPIVIGEVKISGGSTVTLIDTANLFIINNNDGMSGSIEITDGTLSIINSGLTLPSSLNIDGNVTFTGGGTISMGDSPGNRIIANSAFNPSSKLINESIIKGAGRIVVTVENQNLINATLASGLVMIGDVQNTGMLKASSLGRLELTGGTVTNAGGTIRAEGVGAVELRDVTIQGGTFETDGDGVIRGVADVTLDGVGITNAGRYEVNSGTLTKLIGTLNNTNEVKVLQAGTFGIVGDAIFTGGGTFSLEGGNLTAIGGDGILNNSSNTIEGTGNIQFMGVTNGGTIRAIGGALIVTPNDEGVMNTSLMESTSGGNLVLSDGDFFNTSTGTVEANGGNVTVQNAAKLSGGTVSISAGSELRIRTNATITETTVNNAAGVIRVTDSLFNRLEGEINNQAGGEIIVDQGASLILKEGSGYNNAGTISLAAEGLGQANLVIDGDVVLTGGGTLEMKDAIDNRIRALVGTTSRLINEDLTIGGTGQIGFNTLAFTNRRLVDASQGFGAPNPALLIIDPKDGVDGVLNTGTLQASTGGTLRLQNGAINNDTGTIKANLGSTVELNGLLTIAGGELTGNGAINVTTASQVTLDGIGLTNSSQLTVEDGGTLILIGDITNTGSIELQSEGTTTSLRLNGDVTLDGGGSVVLSNFVQNEINAPGTGGTLINEDNTISGAGQFRFVGLTNRGTIKADQSNPLTINTTAQGAINQGSLIADGGTLVLRLGPFANAGGQVEASNGGTVRG